MSSSAETAKNEDKSRQVYFCCLCFASDEDGSWGHTVVAGPSGTHCTNCGAGNSAFPLPYYAVESIRRSASWVGKRYYPHEEDQERVEERKRLLACVESFPGRTVEPSMQLDRDGNEVRQERVWSVKQIRPGGLWASTSVEADTEDEAWEKARYCGLTYYTEEDLR